MSVRELKIGDFVQVKEGVTDPDFKSQLIQYWQGSVTNIDKKTKMIEVEWSLETLINMSNKHLKKLLDDGYDYEKMRLEISELEFAKREPEPLKKDVKLKEKLETKIFWFELFDEYDKVLKYYNLFQGVNWNNTDKHYQIWEEYLNKNLEFPIETKVVESERSMQNEAIVTLQNLETFEEFYGIIGVGRCGRKEIIFPLCELEVIDRKSINYELLKDYATWFFNR